MLGNGFDPRDPVRPIAAELRRYRRESVADFSSSTGPLNMA